MGFDAVDAHSRISPTWHTVGLATGSPQAQYNTPECIQDVIICMVYAMPRALSFGVSVRSRGSAVDKPSVFIKELPPGYLPALLDEDSIARVCCRPRNTVSTAIGSDRRHVHRLDKKQDRQGRDGRE